MISTPDALTPEIIPSKSLVHKYLNVWRFSESPWSFDIFSFLTALGASIGKGVYYDWGDTRRTYAIIHLFLLALSGLGKSSALQRMRELLESLPPSIEKPLIAGPATKEKLISFLQIKSNLVLLASEFAAYFSKERYKENLLPFLVELCDLPPTYHHLGAKKDGDGNGITLVNPQIILACASTVEWLYSASAEAAVSGGFLPRHIAIYEDQKRQKIVLPKRLLGKNGLANLEIEKQELFTEFQRCANFHRGEIDLEDDAADLYCEWAEDYRPANPSLGAFAERSREFVMRLAILIAISCFEHSISKESMECAIKLYLYTQKRLEEVVVPLSLHGRLHKQVLTLIEKSPTGLTRIEIRNSMLHTLSASKTDEILSSLIACERITEVDGKLLKRSNTQ